MADNNSVVQSVKLYEYGKNSLWLSIVHNKQWNRISLDITRKFSYIQDGETKEGSCSTYLNLTAAKVLVDQLPLAYQLAKILQDIKGVEIYNIFCLISEICYTFLTRWAASDRERLCRWSARRHCCIRRHRSLEYRQLCPWRMRTHLRWSKDLGISETELHPCMPQTPVQFPTVVQQTPESRARKAAACPRQTRIKSMKATV